MKLLSQLLKYCYFGGEAPSVANLSKEEWEQLLEEARCHGVVALAYDAILKLPSDQRPPLDVLFHFTSLVQTIESDNEAMDNALHQFVALVDEQLHQTTVVVKGVALARLYPIPAHRERGDNDVFFGGVTPRVNALIESMGIAVDKKDPRHSTFLFNDVKFECHTYLLYNHDDPIWATRAFSPTGSRLSNPQLSLRCLLPEYEAFFFAKHAEHHAVFFNLPLRMRTLMDWSMIITSPDFDYEKLNVLKRNTDVECFADLMTLYCEALFALQLPFKTDAILNQLTRRGLRGEDFYGLYMQDAPRHPLALVRFLRRSWKYMRYGRKYRAIYGCSMFRRFYLRNVAGALHLPVLI